MVYEIFTRTDDHWALNYAEYDVSKKRRRYFIFLLINYLLLLALTQVKRSEMIDSSKKRRRHLICLLFNCPCLAITRAKATRARLYAAWQRLITPDIWTAAIVTRPARYSVNSRRRDEREARLQGRPPKNSPRSMSRAEFHACVSLFLATRANKADDYITCIQEYLKQDFQKCSVYREQPIAKYGIFKSLYIKIYASDPNKSTQGFFIETSYRPLRLEAMRHLKRVALSLLSLLRFSFSNAEKLSRYSMWEFEVDSRAHADTCKKSNPHAKTRTHDEQVLDVLKKHEANIPQDSTFRLTDYMSESVFIVHALAQETGSGQKPTMTASQDPSQHFAGTQMTKIWPGMISRYITLKTLRANKPSVSRLGSCTSATEDTRRPRDDQEGATPTPASNLTSHALPCVRRVLCGRQSYFHHSHYLELATQRLQNYINYFHNFYTKWRIKINVGKSEAIVFTGRQLPHANNRPELTLFDEQISHKDVVKYLGDHMDRKLTCKAHIDAKCASAQARLATLYPILNPRSTLTRNKAVLLYTMLIRPVITYASPTWAHAAKMHTRRLQIIQNKCLRIAADAPRYCPNADLHSELKIEKLDEHFVKLAQKFYTDCANGANAKIFRLEDYGPQETQKYKRLKSIFAHSRHNLAKLPQEMTGICGRVAQFCPPPPGPCYCCTTLDIFQQLINAFHITLINLTKSIIAN
ncbi:hypothetical protein PR048_010974 [Dryococelus australis]|uniref:RNA-directed DNA polymerase from mobile element jockey n=1 Tax=Dryococelus australis TaxID=614101 RepID=A0ABQ9HKB4_9NEOP|nr:hypothetical protein PR048_010974 [Dryococelus australis]